MRSAAYAAPAFATLALAFAGPAAAQSYGQPANAPPGYGQSGYGQPGYGQSQSYSGSAERPERAERPEAPEQGDPSQDLVRQLRLRGDQQAAYRDYQAAFQAQGQGDGNQGDGGQDDIARLAAMTTPQRLDDSARQMDRDRADFERVAAATRRFYATLDGSQKRTFDRLTAPQAEPDGADTDDDGPSSNRPPPPRR